MRLISAIEVKENYDSYFIIDIREPYEYNLSNIRTINIPMNEVCQRLDELPKDKTLVFLCKSGSRASALGNLLSVDYGMTDICVLDGGICAWKELVDQSLIID